MLDNQKILEAEASSSVRWVSEKIAARMTGLSVHTFRANRLKRKGIAFHKVGKSILYSVRDIENFMAAHRIDPTE